MARYKVELFGMSNEVGGRCIVEVDLNDGANLADLVAALRREMPALEGGVISAHEDKLTKHYTFNVNGRFYLDDYGAKVRSEDHIVLLTFALGG
jgi:hypothetical protein